jgi:hypothetical protein
VRIVEPHLFLCSVHQGCDILFPFTKKKHEYTYFIIVIVLVISKTACF